MPLGDGIRRNLARVSQEERIRLRDAFVQLDTTKFYPDGVSYWDKQEDIHKNAHIVANSDVHGGPAFLSWHRELCNRLEALLREVDPMLSLHYWDWTTDPRASDAGSGPVDLFTADFMGNSQGDAGPPFQDFESTEPGHNRIWRNVAGGATIPSPPPVAADHDIITAGDGGPEGQQYPTFWSTLEFDAHDLAHGYIGGTLGFQHFSFHDPFVFLLHSNTDRLWAVWQRAPGRSWRLDPNRVYGDNGTAPPIIADLQPWAGDVGTGVPPLRPWAPPENQQVVKTSQDPTVVAPPDYDTFAWVHLPAKNSGYLLQGRFGKKGNFELVVSLAGGGLGHLWRDNDQGGLPWHGPLVFGSCAMYSDVALLQSNFSSSGRGAGNLELFARGGNRLDFYWRDDASPFTWHGPAPFANNVMGLPAVIQGGFGIQGNFEMVVPLVSGGLAHFWRDNDAPGLPWNGPTPFGSTDNYSAVAMIQSNFSASGGGPGNLEVIARSGNRLDFYWRDDTPPYTWHGPIPFQSGVVANPAFTQGRFGIRGNFEMVVPLATGGLAHFWRDNDAPGLPWNGPTSVFGSSSSYSAVAMIQSNFSSSGSGPGNLEVVARTGNQLDFYWREDAPPFTWHGPAAFANATILVPDCGNETTAGAGALLRASGLLVGAVTTEPPDGGPPFTPPLVIDQSPAPGTQVTCGSRVDLTVQRLGRGTA